jgi:hypothetical protein
MAGSGRERIWRLTAGAVLFVRVVAFAEIRAGALREEGGRRPRGSGQSARASGGRPRHVTIFEGDELEAIRPA